jgi:hypothetical protein
MHQEFHDHQNLIVIFALIYLHVDQHLNVQVNQFLHVTDHIQNNQLYDVLIVVVLMKNLIHLCHFKCFLICTYFL